MTLKNTQQLFTHPQAHPVALDMWLMQKFGPDFILWEPETLWRELELEVGLNVSDANKSKIQALRTVHAQTTPFDLWEVFLPVITALSGTVPRFDVLQPPSISTLLIGTDIMRTVRGKPKLGREVLLFCQSVFLHTGLTCSPPPLEAVNSLLPASEKETRAILAMARGDVQLDDETNPVQVQAVKLRTALEALKLSRHRAVKQLGALRNAQ